MDQTIKKTLADIKSIKIQGATNVAKETLAALRIFASKSRLKNPQKFIESIILNGKKLSEIRSTEPLARNAVKFVEYQLSKNKDKSIKDLKDVVKGSIDSFLQEIHDNEKEIAEKGQRVIKQNKNIFVHCHSSTVENLLILASNNKDFKVFNTETRPLFQGRITSKKLLDNKINDTMVVDSAAPYVISRFSGRDLMMNTVLIGCDAISLDGGAVNKVGSFGIALTAHYEKIPIYIVTNLLKIDIEAKTVKDISIERRNASEIWEEAPKKLKMINFAFDLIPAKFIKGYITQVGIIKPKNIKKAIKRHYSWLLK